MLAPDTGCPRCRNFGEGDLADAMHDLTWVGMTGCGFEQPLEAMVRALDDHPENAGFLRAGSLLAIWFYTDEDDCSAASPEYSLGSSAPRTSTYLVMLWYR